MNWKPIPKEEPAIDPKQKTHLRGKFNNNNNVDVVTPHPKISYRLMQKVSGKLIHFIKKERNFKINELSELITDMQNTVSKLQQKKIFLLEKEAKKQKNKKNKGKKS
jgi:hypothetical protein